MNHLMRELAPVTDDSWSQIDDEAARSLKHFLAARRLVDFSGPLGWEFSAVDVGRVDPLDGGPARGGRGRAAQGHASDRAPVAVLAGPSPSWPRPTGVPPTSTSIR